MVPASASVRTAADQAAQDSKDIKDATSFIQYFLLAFAVIALGVGSFVIYNTLSITLAAPNASASGSATAPTVMPATKSLSSDDAP